MLLVFGVYDCRLLCESELLLVTPETGLMPSAELLLGGVKRLPTLVSDDAVGSECEVRWEKEVGFPPNFCCRVASGGGGSSKVGRVDAFGRRAEKLVGAPMESPSTIEGG